MELVWFTEARDLVQFAGEKPADAGGTGVACGHKICKCCWWDGSGQSCLCENLAKCCWDSSLSRGDETKQIVCT